jgi:hypothetical protein
MNIRLVKHRNALERFLRKHPDQLERVNAILNVANLGYIDRGLRAALIAFTNHTLKVSIRADRWQPVLFGELPRPSKPIYKERRIKVPVKKVVVRVVKERPMLATRYPVLTDVVIPGREGTERPEEGRSQESSTRPEGRRRKRRRGRK